MKGTTIRCGRDILIRASLISADSPAYIPEFKKNIIIAYGDHSSEELEEYTELIRACIRNTTVQRTPMCAEMNNDAIDKFEETLADQPLEIPLVHISPCLELLEPLDFQDDNIAAEIHRREKLAYLLVVQGRSGSFRSRLILKYNLDQVCTALMFEAANGYSIVFSAAILKTSIPLLSYISFKKVSSLDELFIGERNIYGCENEIGFFC